MSAIPVPPEPDAWGLKPAAPSPIPGEAEIGLTAEEDGWGGDPPKPGPDIVEFLMAFAHYGWGNLRFLVLRTRLHLGLNRWRT